MSSYGGTRRMSRLLTAGLWVLGFAVVLAPPARAQEGWGDGDWWKQTTPAAVQERLDRGAEVTARTQAGDTPLHWAARSNANTAVAALLLDRGADLYARDAHGQTPLHAAAITDNLAMAALLLDRGANIDARDKRGQTPLHAAVITDNLAMAALLLDRGRRFRMRLSDGREIVFIPPLNPGPSGGRFSGRPSRQYQCAGLQWPDTSALGGSVHWESGSGRLVAGPGR